MSQTIDLSIIIASYNTLALTRACIESIYHSTKDISFEVIVVDDCSRDGSPEMVAAEFPQVRLIRNTTNQRYAKTNNIGLQASLGRYALLLNSDTVVHEGAFARLVQFMDSTPDAAAAGPKLVNPDGSIQHCIRGFPGLGPMIAQSLGLQRWLPNNPLTNRYYHENFDYSRVQVIDSIGTTAFIIRRSTWEQIGMLDERFSWALVDIAYCYMLKSQGAKTYYFPDAVVTHYGSASINQGGEKEIRMLHQAVRQFYDLYYAPHDWAPMRPLTRLGISARLQFKLLEHRLSSDKRVIKSPGAPKRPTTSIANSSSENAATNRSAA